MKLDVPKLFTGTPVNSGITEDAEVLGERFKQRLHMFIVKNGLSGELLTNVETIMVSLSTFSEVFGFKAS